MLYALISVAVVLFLGLGGIVLLGIVLGDAVERLADGVHKVAATLSEPRTGAEEVAELRRELGIMRRELVDVDEKGEERFKRLQQRRRREAQTVPVEEPDDDADPDQLDWASPALLNQIGANIQRYQPDQFVNGGAAIPLRPSPKKGR